MMLDLERVKATREGGEVKRLHTQRFIGEYNVATHTFNMLCMLKILHPRPTKNLIWAILQHDIPERYIGDIPAPSKWAGSIHIEHEKMLENKILDKIFLEENHYKHLSKNDYLWLKSLDLLELYFFCRDQLRLGNSSVVKVIRRILDIFEEQHDKFPYQIMDLYYEAVKDDWQQTGELDDFITK